MSPYTKWLSMCLSWNWWLTAWSKELQNAYVSFNVKLNLDCYRLKYFILTSRAYFFIGFKFWYYFFVKVNLCMYIFILQQRNLRQLPCPKMLSLKRRQLPLVQRLVQFQKHNKVSEVFHKIVYSTWSWKTETNLYFMLFVCKL